MIVNEVMIIPGEIHRIHSGNLPVILFSHRRSSSRSLSHYFDDVDLEKIIINILVLMLQLCRSTCQSFFRVKIYFKITILFHSKGLKTVSQK